MRPSITSVMCSTVPLPSVAPTRSGAKIASAGEPACASARGTLSTTLPSPPPPSPPPTRGGVERPVMPPREA